jgi:hypothetical protein
MTTTAPGARGRPLQRLQGGCHGGAVRFAIETDPAGIPVRATVGAGMA